MVDDEELLAAPTPFKPLRPFALAEAIAPAKADAILAGKIASSDHVSLLPQNTWVKCASITYPSLLPPQIGLVRIQDEILGEDVRIAEALEDRVHETRVAVIADTCRGKTFVSGHVVLLVLALLTYNPRDSALHLKPLLPLSYPFVLQRECDQNFHTNSSRQNYMAIFLYQFH